MTNIFKRLVMMIVLLAFAATVSAQSSADTLVIGVSQLPRTMDSGDANDGGSIGITRQVVERLVTFVPGTAELAPGLATDWEANDDSTVWTFYLREGVSFQDGEPFNAEAVKFSLDRWNDPENPYHFSDEGKLYVGWRNLMGGFLGDDSSLDEVVVVDDYTVELHLNKPVSFIPALLAGGYFGFDSPAAVREHGAAYGTPDVGSVGTGPYRFVRWDEGSRVVLEANPDYWDGPAKTGTLIFVEVSDATAKVAQLRAGTLDIAMNLTADQQGSVADDPNLELVSAETGLNTSYLAMHQANEPFDDVRVRRAIAHAIDREAIHDAFYGSIGEPAVSMVPPVLWGGGDYEPYEYDPEKAKQLLAEAGYPDGFSTALWHRDSTIETNVAETIATYLADVGIMVSVNTEDWTAYLADYLAGKFPLYTLGWNADFADPDTFIYTFFGPMAESRFGWDNPEVRELVTVARQLPTQEEREANYTEAMNAVHEAMPVLPLVHASDLHAVKSTVTGFKPEPLGGMPLFSGVEKQDQ